MKRQNEISLKFLEGSDLAEREEEILKDASIKTGFTAAKLIKRISWWTSKEIGAFHYLGSYKGKKSVLKIQGVKPTTSEIYMIKSFAKKNKSKILRPPRLYAALPWDQELRYEALVMEYVNGKPVVNLPTNQSEIDRFYELFEEYRRDCLGNPWIDKPEETISEKMKNNFSKWRKASFKLYPSHPLRENEDRDLIDKAVGILVKGYQEVEPIFQHPHLSEYDLIQAGNEVVVLSNLYWGWRAPLYDAIFGSHWFKYHLADVSNITVQKIDEQINLWMSKIESLSEVKNNLKLYKLAMLERYAAGLNLDGLSINSKNPTAEYLVELTRREVKSLISELS